MIQCSSDLISLNPKMAEKWKKKNWSQKNFFSCVCVSVCVIASMWRLIDRICRQTFKLSGYRGKQIRKQQSSTLGIVQDDNFFYRFHSVLSGAKVFLKRCNRLNENVDDKKLARNVNNQLDGNSNIENE